MPGLKDLLKKKDKIAENEQTVQAGHLQVPEIKFIRTETGVEEEIEIPSYEESQQQQEKDKRTTLSDRRHYQHLAFRKSANADLTKDPTATVTTDLSPTKSNKQEKRFSQRLHFRRPSRSPSAESTHLPSNLPEAPETLEPASSTKSSDTTSPDPTITTNETREAQWEERATMLAQANPLAGPDRRIEVAKEQRGRSRSPSISDARADENIQEAIRLHEAGELSASTAMFGRLAEPRSGSGQGANNALAQVLYGLALRHGWGVPVEPERAIHYLSLAASNSASVEREALAAGMKRGGAAKGELVLAMFELGNCFRHGWGVKRDPVAARQYYETAANLGDTDAMEEVAWCYVEGFGGGKDKFTAAKYLRLAEEKGHKVVGNSWIWKPKYDNPK